MKWLSIDMLNNDDNYVKSERSIQYIILIKLFVIIKWGSISTTNIFPRSPTHYPTHFQIVHFMNIRFGRMSTTDLFPYSLTIYWTLIQMPDNNAGCFFAKNISIYRSFRNYCNLWKYQLLNEGASLISDIEDY